MPDNDTQPTATLDPIAGVAAVAFPGAGHIVRGETRRGILAGAGVLGLFFGGMLIGGIDVVDSREDTVWFVGQALVGPTAFGVDWIHQNKFKAYDPVSGEVRSGHPDEIRTTDPSGRAVWALAEPAGSGAPPNRKGVGKVNEIGTLYGTLAGMVNIIVVLDAFMPSRRKRRAGSAQTGASDA